ncbi:MAG: hypothetical protein P9M03_12135 [Candidatus Theseobacter exili]|nr:hypothetical protein [Candidatus Theseobacter exili]
MSSISDVLFTIIKDRFPREYVPEAYEFIIEALEYSVKRLPEKRHISGKELSEGIRDYAKESFGPMTLTVLEQWGLSTTGDYGKIVYRLIDLGLMAKSDTDNISDFDDIYKFDEVFSNAYL